MGGVVDFVGDVVGGVGDAVGGVVDAVGDVASSDIGKVALAAAAIYFGVPAISAWGEGAILGAATAAEAAGAASSLAAVQGAVAGMSYAELAAAGITAAEQATVIAGLSQGLSATAIASSLEAGGGALSSIIGSGGADAAIGADTTSWFGGVPDGGVNIFDPNWSGVQPTNPSWLGGESIGTDVLAGSLPEGGSYANTLNSYVNSAGEYIGPAYDSFGNISGGGTIKDIVKLGKSASGLFGSGGPSNGTLGSLIGAGLGAYGASTQADAYSELAGRYEGYGAPSRARYEASYAPGFTMENDPGYKDALNQSAKGTLHGLSAQGNPADSPNAWAASLSDLFQKSAYPALQNYRTTNSNAGGISSLQNTAPELQAKAIGSNSNIFNAIGSGVSNVFNPPQTLAEQLAALKNSGLY